MNKLTIGLCALGLAAMCASCSNDDEIVDVYQKGGTVAAEAPHWQLTPNRQDVFVWKVDETVHNILNNMLVLGEVPTALCHDQVEHGCDSIGFFAGNECVGVADHAIQYDGKWLYLATVYEPVNFNTALTVAFKDGSSGLTYYWPENVFYSNNAVIGEITEPYQLDLTKAQTYPYHILVDVALPEKLAQGITGDDELAVFCGDECRGVFEVSAGRIRGDAFMRDNSEELHFRYYAASRKRVYATKAVQEHLGDVVVYYQTLALQ